MPIEINLKEDDDRVINLIVTDKHGEVYGINLEFVAHHFDEDDVQIGIYKLPKDHKDIKGREKSCPCYSPNTVIHNEKVIDTKKNGYINSHIWFEFHEVDGLPAVRS